MNISRKAGTVCVFVSAVFYSIGGLCIKFIPWSGIAINGFRTAVALVIVSLFLFCTHHRVRLNRWIFLGALCTFGCNLLYAMANKMTTAANAIVLQFTAPIFVLIFMVIFLKRKPGKLDLAACALVFLGILFFFVDSLSAGGGVGNVVALISGVAYAGIFFTNEMPDGDPISSVFWGQILSAVTGLPFLLRETDFSATVMTSAIILGIFQVGVAYILLTTGLRVVPPVTASLVSGIEPVLNPILVAVFYHELISATAFAGAVIVIGAVVTYNVLQAKMQV